MILNRQPLLVLHVKDMSEGAHLTLPKNGRAARAYVQAGRRCRHRLLCAGKPASRSSGARKILTLPSRAQRG